MAIEPVRAAQIAFSEPYVIIEGTYLVANDAPYFEVAQLDRPEVRIAVGQGAAYDLFCRVRCSRRSWCGRQLPPRRSRCFSNAGWRRRRRASTAAGRRGRSSRLPSAGWAFHRHSPGDGGAEAKTQGAAYVNAFIERCKANGLVKAALQRSGQGEVTVALPPPRRDQFSSTAYCSTGVIFLISLLSNRNCS